MENPLDWLQHWYKSQCDGDWEHVHGIRIKTVDNPGRYVLINIEETECEGKPFSPIKYNLQNEIDWYYCILRDNNFVAGCSRDHLTKVLQIFREWVEKCKGIESNL